MSTLVKDITFYIEKMGSVSIADIHSAFASRATQDGRDYAIKKVIPASGKICRVNRRGVTYLQYFPITEGRESVLVSVTKNDRDKIACLVLNGANLESTANEFRCKLLTATRQVQNFCKSQNPSHYGVLVEVAMMQNRKTPSITLLIQHKKHFLGS